VGRPGACERTKWERDSVVKPLWWQFDDIVVEPPTAQKPYPPIWMGAGSENSIRRVAAQGYSLLLGQYASPEDVAQNIAVYKSEVEARGRRFDPMQSA
jgi:alkanesulfonate monooxygenase SsuD/methylene tetrahydromethanopterin reductase-like flavin-dependent oxidoreductase (luciferase family)